MISVKRGASSNYREGFHTVFGDSYEFIDSILPYASEIFELYDEDIFCGGLCTFDATVKMGYSIRSGAYIYGAFICESARKKGLFKLLCDRVCEFYRNEFYDFVFTVPASRELFGLYEHLGFSLPLYGVIPLTDDSSAIILPQGVTFEDFDNDFKRLYSLHIKNDTLIKAYDFFKRSVSDFNIKYVKHGNETGYALFNDGMLLYASGAFVRFSGAKKGLLMPLTDFEPPKGLLCDILFEI